MTTAQLIQVLIPTTTALIVYVYHLIFQHLPAEQQKALERFAPRAVGMVQQVYGGASNQEKKATAVTMVKTLMQDARLPVPSDASIGTFIESAVYALKQANAQNNVATNTTTIPASLVPPQWLGQPPTSPTPGTGGTQ